MLKVDSSARSQADGQHSKLTNVVGQMVGRISEIELVKEMVPTGKADAGSVLPNLVYIINSCILTIIKWGPPSELLHIT